MTAEQINAEILALEPEMQDTVLLVLDLLLQLQESARIDPATLDLMK